jgi:hypothetical protein
MIKKSKDVENIYSFFFFAEYFIIIPDDAGTISPPVDQPTTTSTIKGSFKMLRDINVQHNSPCAVIGLKAFYSCLSATAGLIDDYKISDHTFTQNRKRVGERIWDASSAMIGHIPKQLDCYLAKAGSPGASPTVDAKIWDNNGVVKYTSPTHEDPSGLTTSLAIRTFDFSTNTRALKEGDRIGVEYLGTSNVDYVLTRIRIDDPEDGNHSRLQVFTNGSWNTNASKDFSAKIWED